MKKICIIVPKGLPLPSVKGGAIETLMTEIIKQNEINQKLDLTVVSIYDETAQIESLKYKNTNFIYINTNDNIYKKKAIYVRVKNLFGFDENTYNERVLDKIKNINFDSIVVEDGAFMSFKSYLKYFKKNQMILHFHHNGISNKNTDLTFGHFIGVSKFVVNTFKNSSTIGDCRVLQNGIDIDKFSRKLSEMEKKEIRNKLEFKMDDFVVIYCGRLIKIKGVIELIKAIKNINNRKIKLMIVGSINFEKNETSDYLNLLKKEILSSDGRIKLTGYVENSSLYKYYQSSNLAIIPSICEDAAPLVTIESMVSGVPLVITRSGGAPEYVSSETVIVEKNHKLIENLSNQIKKLYGNSEKLRLMKNSGLLVSKKYSIENFYNNFVKIVEK